MKWGKCLERLMKSMVSDMQCRGKITQISRDILTRGILITLSLTEVSEQALQTVSSLDDLMVEMKKYRAKRSLDANAYYWKLVTMIADRNHVTNNFQHNMMLREYGQVDHFDSKLVQIMLPDTKEAENKALESETVHLKPTDHTMVGADGIVYRSYILLKGSSEYDTKEMSRLIDGTVSEAKDLGIETLPPAELQAMKERLGV